MILDSNENKERILVEFLQICQIEGWNTESIKKALINCQIDEKFHSIIFENGCLDLIDFYIDFYNQKAAQKINQEYPEFANLKIREKIKITVFTRFEIEQENQIALQRLVNFFINHKNFSLAEFAPKPLFIGLRSCYKIADFIWFFIKDKSTDFNFYSKRLVLSKILLRALFVFTKDQSSNLAKTSEFIDGQISKVMKFEQFKFKAKNAFADKKEILQNICFNDDGNLKSVKNILKNLPFFRLLKK